MTRMRYALPAAFAFTAALLAAGCAASVEPLSAIETEWCRHETLGTLRLVREAETSGVDLTDVLEAARQAEADAKAAGGDLATRTVAYMEVLQADAGYIEFCRTLYDEYTESQ